MRLTLALVAALAVVRPVTAQQPAPAVDFSGLMFGSYNMRTDSAARAALGGESPNQFGIERVYLTWRLPAGDNAAVRVTTDVFQNTNGATNAYYQGWAIRIKYAYFQYTALKDKLGAGSSLTGRVGALHNVVIEQTDQFWPRFLQQNGVERAGFFSSADVGVAGLLTLGNRVGEIYATVVNGPGYTSFERDRFKDFAARLTLTPFAPTDASSFVKAFVITPWFYRGQVGSAFSGGGAGQVGPGDNGAIVDGLTRNRYGVFTGIRDRRLSVGIEVAQREDEREAGLNTVASPRTVTDSAGRLIAGYTLFRPFELLDPSRPSPLSVIARIDRLTPNTQPTDASYAGDTPYYDFVVLGASYELNQRITLALDWQTNTPKGFPAGPLPARSPRQSTVFLHWQATF